MSKPDYILKLEKDDEIFSELWFPKFKKLNNYWKSKKVIKIYEKTFVDFEGKISSEKIILKTTQGFFIYLENEENDMWSMTIYYKSSQENEILLFSKSLLKQLKDATTNNN